MYKFISAFLLLGIVGLQTHCAFSKRENRRLTNSLDSHLVPPSPAGKILLVPVALTVGSVSLLADALVVHPLAVVPESAKDCVEIVWFNPEGGIVIQSFLLVPKIIVTPIVFGTIWIRKAVFR